MEPKTLIGTELAGALRLYMAAEEVTEAEIWTAPGSADSPQFTQQDKNVANNLPRRVKRLLPQSRFCVARLEESKQGKKAVFVNGSLAELSHTRMHGCGSTWYWY